jgi:hypothetical protein
MPNDTSHLLPGQKGRDYHFVRNGGQVYVVYNVDEPGMPNFRISFKIDPHDYDAYGIKAGDVPTINNATFKNFQHLGNASEIVQNGTDKPFDQYLHHLQELNGNVSWLNNKEFLGVMLQGFMEGWDATETQQALSQTKWYDNRTQTQRDWALNLSKADRGAAVKGITGQMEEALRQLYGPDFVLKDTGIDKKTFSDIAQNIASGKFGTADEGFQLWQQRMRNRAEQVEGTPAWIAKEQQQEQQNQFNNRPEDMFQQIQTQAHSYLGPQGIPDSSTLQGWANRLVTGKASEADWTQYLEKQSHALYPWLNPGEQWQDRAASYKNIAEQQLGAPLNWNDKLLANLGAKDANGAPNGAALTFDDFTKAVRSDGRFWQSSTGAQETYGLFDFLNSHFNGSGAA